MFDMLHFFVLVDTNFREKNDQFTESLDFYIQEIQYKIFYFRFTTPHHKEGFDLFLDTIISMEDVWVVTAWQAIQWMRDPTPIQNIDTFKPFQCVYKAYIYRTLIH